MKFTLHSWLLLSVIAAGAGWGGYSLGTAKRPASEDSPAAPTTKPLTTKSAFATSPEMKLVLKTRDTPKRLWSYQIDWEHLECWRVIRNFSAIEVESALSQIGAPEAHPSTPAVRQMLYFRWGQLDPLAAMESAQTLPPDPDESKVSELQASILTAWARKDPEAVYGWYAEQKNDTDSWKITNMISRAIQNEEPEKAMARATAMGDDILKLVATDIAKKESRDSKRRDAFLKLLPTIENSDTRGLVQMVVFREWGAVNPQEALAAINLTPRDPYSRILPHSVLSGWATTNPGAALRWAVEHPELESVDNQARSYVSWLKLNPAEARLWLDKNRVSPAFHAGVTRKLLAKTLETSKFSIFTIQPDTDEDMKAVRAQYARWKAAQPKEAEQWLATINSDVRRKLEGGAP